MLANGRTGLATPDVFYYGNAPGETGNSTAGAAVDGADVARVRNARTSGAGIMSRFDIDRNAGSTPRTRRWRSGASPPAST